MYQVNNGILLQFFPNHSVEIQKKFRDICLCTKRELCEIGKRMKTLCVIYPKRKIEVKEKISWKQSNTLSREATEISYYQILYKRNEKVRAQCRNFRIFLSLRFSVKSIIDNLEVLKLQL